MKRLLLILILVFAVMSASDARMSGVMMSGAGTATEAPAAECTIGSGNNWVNPDHADYWGGGLTEDYNFQEVANSSAKNICKIVLYVNNPGMTHNAVVKIKSTDKATTYGTSDVTEIVTELSDEQVTFNFSTPAEVPANDFIVSVVDTTYQIQIKIAYTTNRDQYFGGTSYKNTTNNVEREEDMAMEIWYEQ